MDIYIFLTFNIIWLTCSVLYHLQRVFIWGQLRELTLKAVPVLMSNPAIPLVISFIQQKTPKMTRKRKVIEFSYVSGGLTFSVPIALNGEHDEPHAYILKRNGEEMGKLILPSRVPLLVTAYDLGCDEIVRLED